MTNFEKVAASPETLGAFLSSLPIATGPWDEQFHRKFCDSCEAENCDAENCPHHAERDNPTWWLVQTAEREQDAQTTVWRGGRMELTPGAVVALKNLLRFHIRATGGSGAPICELPSGGRLETNLEAALRTVEEVKKAYPGAEINVEVEV